MNEINHIHRSVLRLSGEDTLSFLQGVITQNVDALKNGPIFSALLTPQGKILFDFFLTPFGDSLLLDCHESIVVDLQKRLKMYKLRAKVSIDPLEDWCVSLGTHTDAQPDPRSPDLPARLICPRNEIPIKRVENSLYDQSRITLGVPELGADFAPEEKFLLDVNYDALNGVDYKKGCFVGQEVTSRMKRKGAIRKRTLIVNSDGIALPTGDAITADDITIGEITSTSDGVALALIRLDRWDKIKDEKLTPSCSSTPVQISVPEYLKEV